ncbi:hypothetical protein BKA69DRAFT_1125044 [Paraphysoderma sedebokerense]|nr:hypothetical protein BKA69DRAFT_1125044 [Paraphysoderma sedebokerense]
MSSLTEASLAIPKENPMCSSPDCCYFMPSKDKIISKLPGITFKKCGKCLDASYCSQSCQKKHWPIHKSVCGIVANDFDRQRQTKNFLNELYSLLSSIPQFLKWVTCYRRRTVFRDRWAIFQGCTQLIMQSPEELKETVAYLRGQPRETVTNPITGMKQIEITLEPEGLSILCSKVSTVYIDKKRILPATPELQLFHIANASNADGFPFSLAVRHPVIRNFQHSFYSHLTTLIPYPRRRRAQVLLKPPDFV